MYIASLLIINIIILNIYNIYMYVCVHICIYTRMSDTYTFHARIKRFTLRNHNEICQDMRVYTQDTLYVTIQPQYV